jgi:phenylalanyl-tRNA synthetase alpha chain
MNDIAQLTENFITELDKLKEIADIEQHKAKALGKNGFVTEAMQNLKSLTIEQKKEFGQKINVIKQQIINAIEQKRELIQQQKLNDKLNTEKVDITLPPRKVREGSLHPISRVIDELIEILGNMGFVMQDGPEIEDEYHNFTALNIPETHPARQMHDTFYLENGNLLRTHTSNVQIRYMNNNQPPFKIFSFGRTFRCDSDATHTPMFHQIEGLYIDKNINFGHLRFTINQILEKFFENTSLDLRFRPHYFPFTEPSAEVDIGCARKNEKNIVGGDDYWLEVLGCGMVHPNVLENCGIDSGIYQGFAFGLGLERFAMLKYGIKDLRTFFEGNEQWFKHHNYSPLNVPTIIGGLSE